MSQKQALISVEIDTSTHFMHYNVGKYIVLILLWEQLLNFGHGKLGKVMESHGILKASKTMNPVKQTVNRERKNILEHFSRVRSWAVIIHQNCSKLP